MLLQLLGIMFVQQATAWLLVKNFSSPGRRRIS